MLLAFALWYLKWGMPLLMSTQVVMLLVNRYVGDRMVDRLEATRKKRVAELFGRNGR